MNNSVIVSLRDIVVEFDGQRILDGLNLDIHDKEFVTLLGSSGCGKTTTLRLIAGFLEPTSGKVLLKGEDITGVPPYKRPVNTVFQKYALFPHLNVFENVAFGLRLKKMDEETIRRKVRDMLEVVGLKGFERRSIGQMSGTATRRQTLPASKKSSKRGLPTRWGRRLFAKKTSQPQRKQAWCIAASARWWMPGRKWRCPRIVLSCCAILRWMETGQSWICWDFPWSCPVRLHMGTPPAPCIIAGIPNNTNFLRRTYQ